MTVVHLTPHTAMRRVLAWAVASLIIAGTVFGLLALAEARSEPSPGAVVYVAPHEDDEFQFWSLAEHRPDDYKIFATMTRSEETGYCDPEFYEAALQADLGEVVPTPEPEGRWTESCEEARVDSALRYYEAMADHDDTLPGDFAEEPEVFMLDVSAAAIADEDFCREDGDVVNCDDALTEVWVWHDRADRGALVFFNLGDGDLDVDRVSMALTQLLENREPWGLAPELPVLSMVGAYAHADVAYPCYGYPHPDHLAVHETLWKIDFDSGPQIGATCTFDPNRSLTVPVTPESTQASFELGPNGERIGAHERFYGWLHQETYPVSRFSERELFHRYQSFWVRFND